MEFQKASMDNIARALYTLGEQLPLFENLPAFADGRELRDEIQGLEGRVNARLDQVMDLFQQQQAHLQRQQEQLQIQQGQLQGVQEAVDNMHREYVFVSGFGYLPELIHINHRFDLQPMRFYNMSAPTTGVLKGPNGPIPDDYPNKRDMLLTANGEL